MRVIVNDANVGPWLEQNKTLTDDGIEIILTDPVGAQAMLADADAYVGIHFPEELQMATSERFTFLQVTAAGVDHIDLGALAPSVTVANAYGHERSIAEHVLMVSLVLRRRLFAADRALRDGRWTSRLVDPAAPSFTTLRDATVGVVGWGHIAQEVARTVRGFGASVAAVTRTPARVAEADLAEWIGEYDDIERLAAESDILVLACPLVERTHHIVEEVVLSALGSAGILVNVARGALVDEAALYRALAADVILGAAVDVWDVPAGTAPVSMQPLAELNNIVMTPHYSATAEDTYRVRAGQVADNLRRIRRGEKPNTLVKAGVR